MARRVGRAGVRTGMIRDRTAGLRAVDSGKVQQAKENSQVNEADTCHFKGQIQPETQLCPLHSGDTFMNIFSLNIENCISPHYLHSMMTHKLLQSSVYDHDGVRLSGLNI